MIIAIDYDGTIADANREKAKWIKANLGVMVPPWDCNRTDCVPLIGLEAYERMGEHVYEREGTLRASTVPGALGAIRRLARRAELCVVTARPPRRIETAREWLQRNGMHEYIADIRTSDGASKADVCLRIGAQILIDDDLRHLRQIDHEGLLRVLLQDGRPGRPALDQGFVFCGSWFDAITAIEGFR